MMPHWYLSNSLGITLAVAGAVAGLGVGALVWRRGTWGVGCEGGAHALGAGVLLVNMALVVTQYKELLLRGHMVETPILTVWMFAFSDLAARYGWLLVPLVLGLLVGDVWFFRRLGLEGGTRWKGRLWSGSLTILLVLALLLWTRTAAPLVRAYQEHG